jgi:hypothetical protein
MSDKEWKEGFEAGIDFVVTFVNEQLGYKFDGVGEMAAEIQRLRDINKIYEAHMKAKEAS